MSTPSPPPRQWGQPGATPKQGPPKFTTKRILKEMFSAPPASQTKEQPRRKQNPEGSSRLALELIRESDFMDKVKQPGNTLLQECRTRYGKPPRMTRLSSDSELNFYINKMTDEFPRFRESDHVKEQTNILSQQLRRSARITPKSLFK
jgi:hypothetical protein